MELRKKYSVPILEQIKAWLHSSVGSVHSDVPAQACSQISVRRPDLLRVGRPARRGTS